jgi:RNA polymerase sigma-70 factor, ECF subfamily
VSSSSPERLFSREMWASAPSSADKRGEVRESGGDADAGLMALVQAGDESALGELLDRHGRLVLRIGVRVLRDPGEAQELVQDTFLQVFRKAKSFDPTRGSFRSWLTQIAARRAFDRREYLTLHRFYDDRNLDDYVDLICGDVDVEYQTLLLQSEALLRQTFNALSDKQRTTLELYFFEGYTLREISQRLNESLANIRHYYYRALERLKTNVPSPLGDRHE